jgi:hypothetical protein
VEHEVAALVRDGANDPALAALRQTEWVAPVGLLSEP